MKIYLSGPMSNDPNHEYKFNAHAQILREKGFEVVNPVELSIELRRIKKREPTYIEFLLFDLQHLAECDAICMLSGWEQSDGGNVEFEFAKACSIVITYESHIMQLMGSV